MQMVHSEVTGKDYNVRKSIRVINPLQIAKYLANHAEILDLYDSIDAYTGQPCIVAIFDRDSTSELFERWKNHTL